MNTINIETFIQKNIEQTVNNDISDSELNSNYGILKLNASANSPTHIKQHLILTIDRSGSMKTVIENVKHCLINIVKYLIETSEDSQELFNTQIEYVLTIILFDHEIKYICKQQNVLELIDNEENIQDKLFKKISNIQVRGMTNIENVFNAVITEYMEDYKNIHIFMTDGEPTQGQQLQEELLPLLLQDQQTSPIHHNFLGFGIEHNAKMLNHFAINISNASYYFIDNIENAGMIYGEILDKATYKNYTNIKINSNSQYIMFYDVKTTKWMTEITGLDMGNKDEYIYHFKILHGYTHNENVFTIHYDTTSSNTNIMYHTIQQTTTPQDSIYVDILTNRIDNINLMTEYKNQVSLYNNDATLKIRLNNHFIKLKNLNVESQINKQIIQQFMDDIYIHIKLYSYPHCYMYCLARYNAQIYQQSYNITKIDETIFSNYLSASQGFNLNNNLLFTPQRQRQTPAPAPTQIQTNDDLLLNHRISQDPFSIYTTPQRNYTMRCVSGGSCYTGEDPE